MDTFQKSLNPKKLLKEEFVSNLRGSSMLEIASLSMIVPILMVLRHWHSSNILNGPSHSTSILMKKNEDLTVGKKSWSGGITSLSMDFLCVILPIILVFTVLSDWAHVCAICLTLLLLFHMYVQRSTSFDSVNSHEVIGSLHSVRSCISSYRVSVMFVTCICILAVDFRIYPRRYAKTETYGTGLMDLGVGSFVVANALVSRQARNIFSVKWKAAVQSVSPLLLLGLFRLISTAGTNYQVHVGEYGVHWNFFFTLAAVSLLTSMVQIRTRYCGLLGTSILIVYQVCLLYGLNEYLLSDERTNNIISKNKEGLFSIFGYWGMYLIGIQLGNYLFFAHSPDKQRKTVRGIRTGIWFLCIGFWSVTIFLDKYIERISRRMCNLGYVSFVFAQNFQVLAIFTFSELIPGAKLSLLEEAFDKNLLALFLLANMLTGVINLSVDTLSASPWLSLGILAGYAFILSTFAVVAVFAGMRLKFW